jgi:hypothetical protein
MSWKNRWLDHRKGAVIHNPKSEDRACPVLHLFAAIRQERIYERVVWVTENRRIAISISQESKYMTFLI